VPASPEPDRTEWAGPDAGVPDPYPAEVADDREGGLHRFVINWIGSAVAAGRLAAGAQIVPEELGSQLGVSRPVIREALRVLQAKGMVSARPRTGTRVRPVEAWNLLDSDVIGWRVHGPDRDVQLRELFDLRLAIEPSAARGSALAATEQDIELLIGACQQMEEATAAGDLAAFSEGDTRFHIRLLHASGNLLYRRFAGPIGAVLAARGSLSLMPERVDSVVVSHHRSISEAVRDRDPDRAETLIRELIQAARVEIFEAIREQVDI